jgi:SHS2 domain-containing protein
VNRESGSSGTAAGHETIEHTADAGLRVWGPTPEDLFAQAALGMIALLFDPQHVRPAAARSIDLEASDFEEALVAWLQELLYLYEVQRFVPVEVEVQTAGAGGVHAVVRGEPFDHRRHEVRMEIKAATYHGLDIRPTRAENGIDRWECTIIFDT